MGSWVKCMPIFPTRFEMTLSSGVVQVGYENNKTLTCVRGKRYTFRHDTISTHIPGISTSSTSYVAYSSRGFGEIAVPEVNPSGERMVGFFVPFDAPNTLFYCLHGGGYIPGGTINVVDPIEQYDLDGYQSYSSHAPARTEIAGGTIVTYTGAFNVTRPVSAPLGFSPVAYYYRISIMDADSFEVLYEERNEHLHSNLPSGTSPIASFNVANSTGLIVKLEHEDPNHNWAILGSTRHITVSNIPEDRVKKAGSTPSPYTAAQQSNTTVRMFFIRFMGTHTLADPPSFSYLLNTGWVPIYSI